jgi:Putative beta barrel porin-7 (BBP7)
MKSGMLGAFATLFLGAGWALAQGPAPSPLPSGVVMPSNLGVQQQGSAPLITSEAGDGGGPILYANAEYLLWKVKDGTLPSTATATPFGAIPVTATNSGPGAPPTQSLNLPVFSESSASFGNGNRTSTGFQNGGRFSAGFWIDPDMTYGLEVRFLFLDVGSDNFNVNTSPSNAFIAPTGLTQTTFTPGTVFVPATIFVTPVLLTGNVNGRVNGFASNSLYSGEANARSVFLRIGGTDIGGLAGFRFLTFKDQLALTSSVSLDNVTSSPVGAINPAQQNFSFSSVDNTRVYNYFYGGQVGFDIDSKFGPFFVYARGQIAAGDNHQVADVNSRGTTTSATGTTTTTGGLLANPSDNGRHSRDQLSFIPAVDAKVGYQFTDWLRGYVGYGGVYLGSFARAADSTTLNSFNGNATINSTVTPISVAQPNFRFQNSNVYIQGITFGFEAKF